MPRATTPQSESESERVPSKKQKKKEESPADEPMDEDGEDGAEDVDEEYEIEAILDSSTTVFKTGETAYLVKWRGYPDSENSWVKESDAPNADELISKYLDSKRVREKAAKKAGKSRKSTEPSKSEPKKRGRVSTKPKTDSDEEEPEQSPVQPVSKKQKKEKAFTSTKKQVEPIPDEEGFEVLRFETMDRYMDMDSWDDLVEKIDTIERDEEQLFIYGTLTTKEHFRLPSATANAKFPQKVIKFYEDNLRWKEATSEEAT